MAKKPAQLCLSSPPAALSPPSLSEAGLATLPSLLLRVSCHQDRVLADGALNPSFTTWPGSRRVRLHIQSQSIRMGTGASAAFYTSPCPRSERSSCSTNPALQTPGRKATWFRSLGCYRLSASSSLTPVLLEGLPRNP